MLSEMVTNDGICQVVARWTGIPVAKMTQGDMIVIPPSYVCLFVNMTDEPAHGIHWNILGSPATTALTHTMLKEAVARHQELEFGTVGLVMKYAEARSSIENAP